MTRLMFVGAGLIAAAVACVALYLMFSGPHMRTQPKYTDLEAYFRPIPSGTVPVQSHYPAVPTESQAESLHNPLTLNAATIGTGKLYYDYYCVFCHGDKGQGNGPVGESYIPTPADLTGGQTADLPDGQLYRRMLTGPGHEPVLEYTVLPEHRWHIVTYVRYLQSATPEDIR